ncbi:hypothetical protein [Leuconostoc mesenteroides]|uniref:hypothetical protein n=1 Tax=Leuconostoc mesenteroides TaxID=1245 RepID=UPI000B9D5B29|nr:hypothetical protein [Leuconostoc mesenteroides]BAX73120.1 hypothetical protein LEMES_01677 [Leuconostoc mesenteroides]
MVTNKQLRESLLMSKLNLHKPTIKFAVYIDEYGNKNFKVASVTYPNQERKGLKKWGM